MGTAEVLENVSLSARLEGRIADKTARVGVVGLGYVGLPLAVELAKVGFQVTGIDLSEKKVAEINAGRSYVQDVPTGELAQLVEAKKIRATCDFDAVAELDTVNIAVPTPLNKTRDPDLGCVISATQAIARFVHAGMLVILESSTYPGTTEEVLLPILENGGLKVGKELFLCFSPERVDPGNPTFTTKNIPKVVGGVTAECTKLGTAFFRQTLEHVVPVGSTRVAEMVKLLENTFRLINIGLVNEMAILCSRMGIDIWEVIDAAATKPFGFMPFYPGPGLGGHCIPIDPFYLSWKTKQAGLEARFIELAGYINSQMPQFVVDKIQNALNECSKPLRGSHIHVLGVAYKRDIDDVRESPALDIIHLLTMRGARVTYSDPFVPSIRVNDVEYNSREFESATRDADCVAVITDHRNVDYARILETARLIVDTRNVYRGITSEKIVRL